MFEVAAMLFTLSLMRFGNNAENRYIPRIWRDFFDPLALESDTDQLRVKPVIPLPEKCKSAIEVSATHAKTVPAVVESDEWSNDNIEPRYIDCVAAHRLPETEVIHRQFCLG